MPHPDWEDLSEFFDPDEFATEAVISRNGEETGKILGVFDDPNETASLGEYDHDLNGPQFTCSEVAAADVLRHDTALIEGTEYDVVKEPQRDGTGLVTLHLVEQNVIFDAGL